MPDLQHIRLPAGWYPDPHGGDHRRWWDGKAWTQHTAPFQRPAPVYDIDDLAESETSTGGIAAVPAPRRIRTAARLGRGLAALAHRLPVPAPRARKVHPTDEPEFEPGPLRNGARAAAEKARAEQLAEQAAADEAARVAKAARRGRHTQQGGAPRA